MFEANEIVKVSRYVFNEIVKKYEEGQFYEYAKSGQLLYFSGK